MVDPTGVVEEGVNKHAALDGMGWCWDGVKYLIYLIL
jgi:hypothetical protein